MSRPSASLLSLFCLLASLLSKQMNSPTLTSLARISRISSAYSSAGKLVSASLPLILITALSYTLAAISSSL